MDNLKREQVVTTHQEPGSIEVQDEKGFRAEKIFYYILGVVEALLGLRFLLKIFGANSTSPFVDFMYGVTSIFVAPFRGIFPALTDDQIGSVLEWSTLTAMFVYALLVYGIARLIQLLTTKQAANVQQDSREVMQDVQKRP